MPSSRWSCPQCGLINAARTDSCRGCPWVITTTETEWKCPSCAKMNVNTVCCGCQYRKPLPKEGVPQIFEGFVIVFTGIIPRSIPHSSAWPEWQQAEQRGAQCKDSLCPEMTHLVYKEGFERSDKVKKAAKMGHHIKIVNSEWFHQSIRLNMCLDDAPYNLAAPQRVLKSALVQGQSTDIAAAYSKQLRDIAQSKPIASGEKEQISKVLTPDGDFTWMVPPAEKQPLLSDMFFVCSPGVGAKDKTLAEAYSAKIMTELNDDCTHLIVLREEASCPLVSQCKNSFPQVNIVTNEWLQHCIQLAEVLPCEGPYKIE